MKINNWLVCNTWDYNNHQRANRSWRIARRQRTIYTSGDGQFINFIPITNLPALSKTFKNVMHIRSHSYLQIFCIKANMAFANKTIKTFYQSDYTCSSRTCHKHLPNLLILIWLLYGCFWTYTRPLIIAS